MIFLSGCGRWVEPVSADPTETVNAESIAERMESSAVENNSVPTETEKPDVTAEATQTFESVQTLKSAETVTPVETEGPAEAEKTVEAEKPAVTQSPTEPPTPAQPPQPEAPTPPPAPVQTSQPEAPTPPPTPAQPPEPVHEHSWKEHYAETQTWIPNIVVVEDYGEIPGEQYGLAICSCGFETTDTGVMSEHYKEGYLAGTCVNFTVQTHWTEPTWGVIGSHEEDQGHYETSTYVDYYYCDCGATK